MLRASEWQKSGKNEEKIPTGVFSNESKVFLMNFQELNALGVACGSLNLSIQNHNCVKYGQGLFEHNFYATKGRLYTLGSRLQK